MFKNLISFIFKDLFSHYIYMEEYKKISDFDNYEVSIFGIVRNINTKKILKQSVCTSGYYRIELYKNGTRITKRVHRIVAETFLENPDDKLCVDHIDNNKLNNSINNLRWATLKENQRNRKINLNNTSGVKGLYFEKTNQKWRAQIKIDGIKIHLGYYKNIEDAKQARITKANEVFGEFTNDCEKIKKI